MAFFSCPLFAEDPPTITEVPTIQVIGRRPVKRSPEASEFFGDVIDVSERKETSLGQLLKLSPALQMQSAGGEGNSPTFLIRGQDAIENRYFLEGIPLTGAEYNSANLSLVPLESLSEVEIFPQGSPVTFAEDGLGGAVNFRLEPLQSTSHPLFFSSRVGSYEFVRAFAKATLSNPFPARVGVEYTRSKEDFVYFNDNGTPFNFDDDEIARREHNQFRKITLVPQIKLFENETQHLQLFNLTSWSEIQIPGAIVAETRGTLQELSALSALLYDNELSSVTKLKANVYVRRATETLAEEAPSASLSPGSTSDWQWGARFGFHWQPQSLYSGEAVTGATWEQFRNQLTGLSENAANERLVIPLGVSTSLSPLQDDLTVKPACLADYNHYALNTKGASDRDYFLVSPRLTVSGRPVSFGQWRVSVGSFNRAPSMYELFGDPAGTVPSPGLTYEKALKGELGTDLSFRKLGGPFKDFRLSYSWYASRAHDLITFVQNSQQSQVATNIGESFLQGHELSLELTTAMAVNFRASAALMKSINLSDRNYENGKSLPYRPPYSTRMEVAFEGSPITVSYILSITGPFFTETANLQELSSVVDHSAMIGWDTKRIGTFLLEGRNLGDVITASANYGSLQTTDNTTGIPGYPAPGRRVYLSWKYEL
jgi:vitamin B12 transporter